MTAELPTWLPEDGKQPKPIPAPQPPTIEPPTIEPPVQQVETPAKKVAKPKVAKPKVAKPEVAPAADRKVDKPAAKKPAAKKPVAKKPATKKPAPTVALSGLAAEIVAETNRVRAANGLSKLKVSGCLANTSRTWAVTMDDQDLWEHSNLRATLNACDYTFAGENLAQVRPDASAAHVVDLWMNSAGHRANLLSEKATLIAVAVQYDASRDSLIVVQQFGRP